MPNTPIDYCMRARDLDEIASALDQDILNISASLEWAYEHNQNELVVAICSSMQYLWSDRWLTDRSLRYLPWAIDAAKVISQKTKKRDDFLSLARLA